MKSTAHSSLLSITPFDSPFTPTITVLKELMIFAVFPNSVLLCNPFQSGIVSFREIALLKSPETSILPLDISVLFLFNCLATFEKCLSSLSLKILLDFNSVTFVKQCARKLLRFCRATCPSGIDFSKSVKYSYSVFQTHGFASLLSK